MSHNRFINFILSYGKPEIYRWMVDYSHDAGLTVTHFIDAMSLSDKEATGFMKKCRSEYGDEIVVWLGTNRKLLDRLNIKSAPVFFNYYSDGEKKKLADTISGMFKETFGRPMEAAAYFNLDAASLRALKTASPDLVTVMTCCFEEGLNVYHGHRYFDLEWLCFTEGGPWWPWIPRLNNSIVPAGQEDDKIDVVCLPHLNRDLIQSFDARDDWYSSQPMDEMRSKSVSEKDISYTKRFFNEYMRQAEFNNGYAYYQFFETPGPLTPDAPHVFDEPSESFRKVFKQYVDFLGTQVKNGTVRQTSLVGFGKWFLKNFSGATPSTVGWWRDIRFSSKKEYLWYLDHNLRILFAANRGGSILDLRPYKAAITGNTGIDTENLWDGSYPFVIQNHHRYTTVFKGMLRYDGEIKDISEVFMRIKNVRQDENGTVITYEPVHITIGTCDITLEVITIIGKDGSIVTERHFTGVSKPGETLEFCDYLRGSLGTNDLPANLAGTGLEAVGSSKRQGIIYAHRGRHVRVENLKECRVSFPVENFTLVLTPGSHNASGTVTEGTVFQAFYTIEVRQSLQLHEGIRISSRLTVERDVIMPEDSEGSLVEERFKTAWGPSKHPLRCPNCLTAGRETHMLEDGKLFRCPDCSFVGNRGKVEKNYNI